MLVNSSLNGLCFFLEKSIIKMFIVKCLSVRYLGVLFKTF